MKYEHMIKGTFISRPNRFIAHVLIHREDRGEEIIICHVKNTGRCRELLLPGVTVLVQFHPEARASGRKTEFSLISVWKEQIKDPILINMDSQAPNQAAYEWLHSISQHSPLPLSLKDKKQNLLEHSLRNIRREVTCGQSRIDLAFQAVLQTGCHESQPVIPAFMEVKGVTLEENGLAMFPDAPTERGIKHIMELENAHREGYETYLLFVIQMKGMRAFSPNKKTHPEFAEALKHADEAGVHILAYDCAVTENTLTIDRPVPVCFL